MALDKTKYLRFTISRTIFPRRGWGTRYFCVGRMNINQLLTQHPLFPVKGGVLATSVS
jgi:hypothetical protein